jgi:hypothetical protein
VYVGEALLRNINILKIVQMFQDGFAGVISLGPPSSFGQGV